MDFQKSDTAVVFIDPQNDVLSEKGANWGSVGASVTENNTVTHMEQIFRSAKDNGYQVFISPHYFYPTDSGWRLAGPLEADEFRTRSFARQGPLSLDGFLNSGADWLDSFKPYIEDGQTIVVSPHKVWGPRPTIWSCSCANGGSARSSSAECWRTCALSPTCGSYSSRASRSPWSKTPRPARVIPNGVTATRRR
jgi:hypothetical protein